MNGVLPSEMVISYMVLQFGVICLQAAITVVFILLVFGVTCNGPVGALVGLTLLQGTAGMAYGEFVVTDSTTQLNINNPITAI